MAVLVSTLVLVWFPAWAGPPASHGQVLHLDARGLDLLLQSDPNLALIDVRTPAELAGPLGRIPQSRNVPMQELERTPTQFPHDKTLVLICRSGHRSLKAAELLAEHGYVVYSVDGGMGAWREIHPQPSPNREGSPRKEPAVADQPPDAAKPPSQDPGGQPPAERFFDTNMGC